MGLMTSLFGSAISDAESRRNPGAWLLEGLRGTRTTAGLEVTPDKALKLSAVFACVRNLAEDVAKLPLKLYRKKDERTREQARDEALFDLLHTEPNPEMSSFDFRQAMMIGATLHHGGFAEIVRAGGRPIELWPISPSRVRIKRDSDGVLYYEVRGEENAMETSDIPARDMLHVRGFSRNGVVGEMMMQHATEAFGIYMAAEVFTARYFANGTAGSGLISFEGAMKPEVAEKFKKEFEKKWQGVNSTDFQAPIMLSHNGKYTPITVEPEKSQLIETLQFRIEDIARWFRMPPHKIQQLLRSTFNNIEHQSIEYGQDTLLPWLIRHEMEYDRKLIAKPDRSTLFTKHDMNAVLRADTKSRYASYALGINNGILSRNECRQLEDLNPYEGGDSFLTQQNMATVNKDGSITPNNEPDAIEDAKSPSAEFIKAAVMPSFVSAAEKLISREANAIASKKNPSAEWLDKFYAGHHTEIVSAIGPVVQSLAQLVGAKHEQLAERYADSHVGESRRRLDAGEDPQKWMIDRPAWIARHLTDEVCNER